MLGIISIVYTKHSMLVINGISRSKEELSLEEDIQKGADVLYKKLKRVSGTG